MSISSTDITTNTWVNHYLYRVQTQLLYSKVQFYGRLVSQWRRKISTHSLQSDKELDAH